MRVCDGGAQATVSAVTDPVSTSAFELPDRLAAKADPTLIAADERHFADIAARLDDEKADLAGRLAVARRQTIGEREGQEVMERDQNTFHDVGIGVVGRRRIDLQGAIQCQNAFATFRRQAQRQLLRRAANQITVT